MLLFIKITCWGITLLSGLMEDITMTDGNLQQEIEKAVWAACDTFRGVIDATQYKDYILVTLFLKYISDVWQAHYKEYKAKWPKDKERILRRLTKERFVLPKGRDFYALHAQRHEANIGERFNIALQAIEDENKEKLKKGVFRSIDFNSEANLGSPRERNRRLCSLLENFNKPALDLSPERVRGDIIGNAYMYLIERFAADTGKKGGEFYTPQTVAEVVARLCQPKSGGHICDPACGSGGLLLEAKKAVKDDDCVLFGMESNGATRALCRLNMFLHNADSARIEWCNSLTEPELVENDRLMKFDSVVANPPFSLDKWGADKVENDRYRRFSRGIPPNTNGDYAFISHMVESAKDGTGRVAVIAPHGVLFRGHAEGRIRQRLIEDNLLDAVVALPAKLFQTVAISVVILVFDRARERGGSKSERHDVLFIDASHDFQEGKNQNRLLPEHVNRIVATYEARKDVEGYAALVSYDALQNNGFNLSLPRYVRRHRQEEVIDIEQVRLEIEQLEKAYTDSRQKIDKLLKEATS